jgi:hypothetical protein
VAFKYCCLYWDCSGVTSWRVNIYAHAKQGIPPRFGEKSGRLMARVAVEARNNIKKEGQRSLVADLSIALELRARRRRAICLRLVVDHIPG